MKGLRLAFSVPLGIALICILMFAVFEVLSRFQVRDQFIEVLQSVESVEDGRKLAGDEARAIDLLLEYPDGSWTAFCHFESNLPGLPSLTLGRDNAGHWYQSNRRFRVGVDTYRKLLDDLELVQDLASRYGGDKDELAVDRCEQRAAKSEFHRVAKAPDLDAARRSLVEIGFEPCRAD